MSPITATSGDRTPSADLSKPMRLTWIAKSTATIAAIQPRSALARATSSACSREPVSASRCGWSRPMSAITLSSASCSEMSGAVTMLTVTVSRRTPAAIPTTQFVA